MNMKGLAVLIVALIAATEARTVIDRIVSNPNSGEYEVREVKTEDSLEDGPFGGDGGHAWTDGGEVHLKGPITQIEVRHGNDIDGLKTR